MEIAEQISKVLQGKICPYCLEQTEYGDSSIFYGGRSYGMVYYCLDCDARVGVHQGTDKALGRLANAELRKAKKEAHRYFDALWKAQAKQTPPNYSPQKWRRKCRSNAYKWLSEQLQVPVQFCHIGMFDVEYCYKIVELCKNYSHNTNHDYTH